MTTEFAIERRHAPHTGAAPRHDLYAGIHKALRAFMADTLRRVGALDATDEADMARTLSQVMALLAQLRSHLKHENDFLHTAIEARQPKAARRTAGEHIEHLETIATLEAEVQTLQAAAPVARAELATRLYRHLALFVAENLLHMHIEETANNAALWALYTDAELVAIHDQLVRSIPPADMMATLRWMAPAFTPQELAGLLNDMQRSAPPEAMRAVLDVVRPTLEPERWHKLARALNLPMAGRA
jgi:ABC-type transporter Mla subunit MlaD